jgi:molybdopterin molybdotransferase
VANDWQYGTLAHELEANGGRESYLRGSRYMADEGRFEVRISPRQDSALTTTFAEANCLVQRKPNAPALKAGANVKILPL